VAGLARASLQEKLTKVWIDRSMKKLGLRATAQ
jgi:hypothetical protein